jgi:ThiF family
MNVAAATRFARQIALPEVGPTGQTRLGEARVAIVGGGLAAETAARYLAAAGVGTLRLLGGDSTSDWDEALRGSNPDVALEHDDQPQPDDGAAWMEALSDVDLVVREGFDDDSMLRAAVRLGVPAVVVRGRASEADVLSFRTHGPCPHAPLDVASVATIPEAGGASEVVAGTLGATEALLVLVGTAGGDKGARARHLRVPLDGREATAQVIPWTPECFACGGSGAEMSFA